MVWRPLRASSASAACTASRISFTPENTAEIAMNSASKAVAMRRAQVGGQLHRLDPAGAQPPADALEPRFAVAGLRFEPFEAVALAGVAELERRLDVARAREQGCRGRAEGLRQLAHRSLLELPIVD